MLPYWTTSPDAASARWKLAGVIALTLSTTGISVVFNFIGRDFFNALSEKNVDVFQIQLLRYLAAFTVGIPAFVLKSYFQSKLALDWRKWMTEKLLEDYLADRTYYQLQAGGTVDNPDQRLQSDIRSFTDSTLGLGLTLINAGLDLISFSGILFAIYPPLFVALLLYSAGGTIGSIYLGKSLVGLNFNQEAREADLRYNLVRLRDNAEGVAFYRGEASEGQLLKERLGAAVSNYLGLLTASRNLDFFTSFYRYLIQLLPAAVVAPLFFAGKIEFGVINQSQSAFNHVLNDFSLIVYQFDSLAGFGAVIDRLGQFQEEMAKSSGRTDAAVAALPAGATAAAALAAPLQAAAAPPVSSRIQLLAEPSTENSAALRQLAGASSSSGSSNGSSEARRVLLSVEHLSVVTPGRSANLLVQDVSLEVLAGEPLLIMGPSGAGKTSLLRAAAGLWSEGAGTIRVQCASEQVMFLPQKPYMVAGTLRDQVLYPRWQAEDAPASNGASSSAPAAAAAGALAHGRPSDAEVLAVLARVRLGGLLTRYATADALGRKDSPAAAQSDPSHAPSTSSNGSSNGNGASAPRAASVLDAVVDWTASLSQGEQQRLAWARLLMAKPQLALLDEATSALDQDTEAVLYQELLMSGITYVSVGHRATLREYHRKLLQLVARPAAEQDGAAAATTAGVDWEVLPLAAPGQVLK